VGGLNYTISYINVYVLMIFTAFSLKSGWALVPPAPPTMGSHIHVACRSVCDRDQERTVKIVLDRLILLEFKGQNVATPAKYLRKCVDRLILVAQNPS